MNYLLNVNKLLKLLIILSFYNISFSQETSIKGKITDSKNKGIEGASISILNESGNIVGYNYTDADGNYLVDLKKINNIPLSVIISCLGYQKFSKTITTDYKIYNFQLEEITQTLKEVVVESGKKIKIEHDTTTIKIASFTNKTEQTIEDVLKKLPGIVVLKDGTIKAHGKNIDKLLVEGVDILDKNYKILSKNLDAKVVDEVQIIDNFEDNPILKKLNDSDKVALNLKFKKGLSNIWFGNVNLGIGIISKNRWKENINLGLLKKKIKFFYFGDFNNTGDNSTELVNSNILVNSSFGEDRFEYKTKNIYSIQKNEINLFSKTQSIFNTSLLNSLSFNSKINKKLSLRGVAYLTNDKQNQNTFSSTRYNLEVNPFFFNENNFFSDNKAVASTELELKYSPNNKNYITNLFILKNNQNQSTNNSLFNSSQINQELNSAEQLFYNHFNHTLNLSDNKILNNYIYLGKDFTNERSNVLSPFLNSFLNINENDSVNQNVLNRLDYYGLKSKLISKYYKINLSNSIQLEYNKETLNTNLIAGNQNIESYQNKILLKNLNFTQENTFRYNFSRKIDITSNFTLKNVIFSKNNESSNLWFINSSLYINIKKTNYGNFSLSYTEDNSIPDTNQLSENSFLTNYRTFTKGNNFNKPIKNQNVTFNYHFYNDEKRWSINTNVNYNKLKSVFNTMNSLSNNLTFNSYIQTNGGENYNCNFSLINYIRPLKLASKIELINNWYLIPANINSQDFLISKSILNSLKYSASTYFKTKINFDFGFSYNSFKSNFQGIENANITKDGFLNINFKISNTIIAESNNAIYLINKQKYSFNNIILSYTPLESKFSYRIIVNNIADENQYTNIIIDNYIYYKSTMQLVPRYILGTIKYRF